MAWRELVGLVQGAGVRTFGEREPFKYTPAGKPACYPAGVFREKSTYIDPQTTVQVSTEQPTLDVAEADLPGEPTNADVVEPDPASRLAGRRWRVSDWNKDGEGMLKLFLIDL